MQYAAVKSLVKILDSETDGEKVVVSFELFRKLLILALRNKNTFDENFYLWSNPDIEVAIANGSIASAADHYYETGYFEGRLPCRLLIDERFYLEENLDVAEAVRKGGITSPQEHFEYTGFNEGRLPFKGFSLF